MNKTIHDLANWPRRWPIAGGALAVALVGVGLIILGAKGGIPGPPVGGETPNNLSVPGVQTQSATSVAAYWAPPGAPELGVHYSYGCDKGESNAQFSYPNTSCVDSLDLPTVYYTATECTDDVLPSPCQGMAVERIYWQKVPTNEWWADDTGVSPNAATVDYVDWGDALEAVSWTERSVIRVETQPWTETIDGFNPMIADPALNDCAEAAADAGLDPAVACKIGLQMWHVSGQGITEHWGVRAGDSAPFDSFNYDTAFQIAKSTEARLNLTKLVPESAVCSAPGGNPGDDPPVNTSWNGSGWDGTCEWYDEEYSVETSVGGKFVFGYVWRMGDVDLEPICGLDWQKTGFWRLTFYAPDGDVIFDDADAPNVAPPAVPVALRALPRTAYISTEPVAAPEPEETEDEHEHEATAEPVLVTKVEPETVVMSSDAESEDPDADDRLYRPVVDVDHNLSYIDICIVAKDQGGGGGGGGGGGHVDAVTQTDAASHTGGAGGRGGGRGGGGGGDHGDH